MKAPRPLALARTPKKPPTSAAPAPAAPRRTRLWLQRPRRRRPQGAHWRTCGKKILLSLMNAVPWYADIEQQVDYLLNFICGPDSAEQEKVITGICTEYDRNMLFQTRKDTLGIYLVHLFEVWRIVLRYGTDWNIPGIFFLSLVMTRIR